MDVKVFSEIINCDFYTGVPDSQLKALCNYLQFKYPNDPTHHVIAANEGNCVALAAGYNLATGRIPAVYMQNSGEGNVINPVCSLLNKKVYSIPMLFIIGWRGEPGVKDEPQHIFQGEVTLKLLEDMGIEYFILSKDTDSEELKGAFKHFKELFDRGDSAAIVVRKGALSFDEKPSYKNEYKYTREEIIRHITDASGKDPVISTTGKASRELFEIREAKGESHKYDFLTVGSMGHASSIALGVALNKPNTRIWCIDGDGAALMHMGALAVIGKSKVKNLIHVVINNCAHETVGGMPTAATNTDLCAVALACGYESAVCVEDPDSLDKALEKAKSEKKLSFVEIKCQIGAREDLGRPTTTALENKLAFCEHLKSL